MLKTLVNTTLYDLISFFAPRIMRFQTSDWVAVQESFSFQDFDRPSGVVNFFSFFVFQFFLFPFFVFATSVFFFAKFFCFQFFCSTFFFRFFSVCFFLFCFLFFFAFTFFAKNFFAKTKKELLLLSNLREKAVKAFSKKLLFFYFLLLFKNLLFFLQKLFEFNFNQFQNFVLGFWKNKVFFY